MPVKRKFLSCGLALLLCSVYGNLGALAGAPAPEKAAHHCTAALCASQDAQAPTSTPVPGRRLSSQPGFTGWTLLCTRLPRNFVALGQWYYADNTYAWDYQWRGELDLSLQRMKPVTMTEAGLSQALVSWGQQPSALTYQADAALTQQLGLPTYRATYFEGVGEAQRTNLDVLVQTEKWTLRFHAAAASDRWGDYAGLVEGMHLGLVAGDSDAWPQVPDLSPEEDPWPERQLENLQPYLDRLAGAALASETPGYGQGGRPDAALAWALLQDVLQDQGAAGLGLRADVTGRYGGSLPAMEWLYAQAFTQGMLPAPPDGALDIDDDAALGLVRVAPREPTAAHFEVTSILRQEQGACTVLGRLMDGQEVVCNARVTLWENEDWAAVPFALDGLLLY